MFSASADLYDLLYSSFKDYPAETRWLAEAIRRINPSALAILDVACGTGEHARLLTETQGFSVDGLDIDPAFVRIARQKIPRADVFEADMRCFRLPRRYDAVICLFSSIAYVGSLANVTKTLECFHDHIGNDGIVLVEPWYSPHTLLPGRTFAASADGKGVSVCRMTFVEIDARVSRLHFEYLIGRPAGIQHASEVHELGLFTTEELLSCFAQAGFRAEYDPVGLSGRGLFIARRNPAFQSRRPLSESA